MTSLFAINALLPDGWAKTRVSGGDKSGGNGGPQ